MGWGHSCHQGTREARRPRAGPGNAACLDSRVTLEALPGRLCGSGPLLPFLTGGPGTCWCSALSTRPGLAGGMGASPTGALQPGEGGGGAQCCTYSPSCRQPRLLTGRAGPGGILRGRTQKMPLEGGGTGWGNGAQLGASGQLCCSAVAGERLTQHPTLRPLGFCNDRRVGGL